MTFSIFGCFAACGFLASSLGWRSLEQDLKHNKGLNAVSKYDSLKGFLVLFFGWAYILFYSCELDESVYAQDDTMCIRLHN